MLDSPRKSLKYLKEYRLARKSDMQSVFDHPAKITYKYLLALYCPNSLAHARLGILLSKSRLPRAVDRNRLKRAIRESFRTRFADLPAVDLVVMLRGKCSDHDPGALRADVEALCGLLVKS